MYHVVVTFNDMRKNYTGNERFMSDISANLSCSQQHQMNYLELIFGMTIIVDSLKYYCNYNYVVT